MKSPQNELAYLTIGLAGLVFRRAVNLLFKKVVGSSIALKLFFCSIENLKILPEVSLYEDTTLLFIFECLNALGMIVNNEVLGEI